VSEQLVNKPSKTAVLTTKELLTRCLYQVTLIMSCNIMPYR